MVEKIKVNLADMRSMLCKLLNNEISREEAANWALKLREESDKEGAKCPPEEVEELIWDCILFIEGIDLQDTPNSYLHNDKDIEIFLKSIEDKIDN